MINKILLLIVLIALTGCTSFNGCKENNGTYNLEMNTSGSYKATCKDIIKIKF